MTSRHSASQRSAPPRVTSHRSTTLRNAADSYSNIDTWAQFAAATPEQRRRWRDQLLLQWEWNRERELDEDAWRDGRRGHWGD